MFNPRDQLLKSKAILFDSDGVLVEEGDPLAGAVELLEYLRDLGKKIVVLSNNSTKHPHQMQDTYHNKGLKVDNIVNSGMVMAEFCKNEGINRVFVVGELGLVELLQEYQLTVTDRQVDAVIVGMDRDLTYDKLAKATRMIRSGSRFLATNPDPSFPTNRGLEPGAGSMIAALVASTDQQPEVIVGKPKEYGYKLVLSLYDLKPKQCLMIGDRYETDIAGALKVGIPAVIVNTGVAKSRRNPGIYGDYPEVPVIQSLEDLL